MPNATRTVRIANVALDESDIDAAVTVLRSGAIRQGKVCEQFERRFASMVGARHGVVTSSGTAALHLAWLSLLRPGDEVLVPTFSFIATATTIALAGGLPVFCDVDPTTFTIDTEDARRRITGRTRAIAPVHLYGQACDVEGVSALAAESNLRVVWDAAQAHGTMAGGADVGSIPDTTCYSFYPTKSMTTGEGGMITTDDDAMADRLRLLRSHGQERKYHHTALGLNYRSTDFQAALGLGQLERLREARDARIANAARLSSLLSTVSGIRTPEVRENSVHSFHQYTIVVDKDRAGLNRDQLSDTLKAVGVETAVHYPEPIHRQPIFADGSTDLTLPVAEELSESVLSLPVHAALSESDVTFVAESVATAVSGALQ